MKAKENTNINKSFDYFKVAWMFIIFSVVGFIIESSWCLIKNGVLESRQGLIYGPFTQVYGIGAIILFHSLNSIKKKTTLKIFLYSMLIGGVFEYICSYLQEFAFGSVSWAYKNQMFSGRTSLVYSIFWGVLGVILMRYLYPLFNKYYKKLIKKKGIIITKIVIILMSFNIIISASAVYRQNERIKELPANNSIERLLDKYYPDQYLKKIYPNMKFK